MRNLFLPLLLIICLTSCYKDDFTTREVAVSVNIDVPSSIAVATSDKLHNPPNGVSKQYYCSKELSSKFNALSGDVITVTIKVSDCVLTEISKLPKYVYVTVADRELTKRDSIAISSENLTIMKDFIID